MIVVLAILLAFQFGDAKFERISELLDKVDFSVNPCQNFSAFVCTNETREMLDSNRVDVRQLFYETLEKNKVGRFKMADKSVILRLDSRLRNKFLVEFTENAWKFWMSTKILAKTYTICRKIVA
jgi:hypothetical protein